MFYNSYIGLAVAYALAIVPIWLLILREVRRHGIMFFADATRAKTFALALLWPLLPLAILLGLTLPTLLLVSGFRLRRKTTPVSQPTISRRSVLAAPAVVALSTMGKLVDDDELEIEYQPGNGKQAVISFAGIGMGLGGIQIAEFQKSLNGSDNHLFFVKDKSKHWYNSDFDRVPRLLNRKLQEIGAETTATIGNSMGGFGAIFFAGALHRCDRVLAFSAQSCVDPSIVPWEKRYTPQLRDIKYWRGLDATKRMSKDIRYTLMFGNADPIDFQHADRFKSTRFPSMSLFCVDGATHNLAADLKRMGRLQAIIDQVIVDKKCLSTTDVLKGLRLAIDIPGSTCV